MVDALLEVRVLHPADAEAAAEGGADRLLLVASGDGRAHSPDPALVSAVVRATALPVRALLRLADDAGRGDSTTGAGLARMAGLARDYAAAGAEGVAFGFLTDRLEVDVELCTALADQLPGPWTFTRAVDRALDHRRAWRSVVDLPGLDGVLASGSATDATRGHDALLALARDERVVRLLLAADPLAEHVPWLVRGGVRGVHLGGAVRPDGSWDKAHTDPAMVRAWRLLLDDELGRVRAGGAGGHR